MNMETLVSNIAATIPDPLFLVIAAGFLGVIMAFLIPLSIEIISKVSAKYNSDVIVRLYKDSFINRIFTYLLLFAIAAMMTTRFFNSESFLESATGKIIMWSILSLSILITILIGYLIRRMDRFISDDAMPLAILYKDVAKALGIKSISHSQEFKGAKALSSPYKPVKRERFILATEGIGDILVYQVGRQNNSLILNGLERISWSIYAVYAIRHLSPVRFDELIYDEELLMFTAQNKQNKQATHEFCFNDPNKNLAGLASPLNQLKRIYKAALEKQNSEVARVTLQKINTLLLYLATQPDNAFLVEFALKNLIECTQLAIRTGDESADLGIHWYVDALHQEPHQGKGAFQLDYLDIYNKYFMGFVSHILAETQRSAFHSLARYLIRIYAIPNYQRGKIWGYHYLLRASDLEKYRSLSEAMGIQRQVRYLAMMETHLDTMEQLESWLARFQKLRESIQPHLIAAKKSEARRLDEIIQKNAIRHFKQRRLLRAAYALGAHCLFRGEHNYLSYLWDQAAADNEEIRTDISIVPQTVQQVINDYLRRTDVLSKPDFGDVHFRIESYFKRYYVLLLIRTLKEQDSYILPIFSAPQLHQVENSLDELMRVVEDMKDSPILNILDLDKKTIKRLMDTELLRFLRAIKEDAHKQLLHNHQKTKISQRKCNAYKKQLLVSWEKHASLRDIFSHYLHSFKNRTIEDLTEKPRGWGIDELINKSALLENWDPARGIGFRHGRTIANSENSFLFDSIAEHCTGRSQRSFEKVLNTMAEPENLLIIAPKWAVINFLAGQEKFTLGHSRGAEATGPSPSRKKERIADEFSSFIGYYDFNEHNIPVFVMEYSGSGHQMLVLNRNRLGTMVQMPLYSMDGKKHRNLQNDVFHFEMKDLTTSPKLVNYYIKQRLPWLQEKGDTPAQRNYLRELMLVKILENVSFEQAADFIGYSITITAKQPSGLLDYETSTGLLPI